MTNNHKKARRKRDNGNREEMIKGLGIYLESYGLTMDVGREEEVIAGALKIWPGVTCGPLEAIDQVVERLKCVQPRPPPINAHIGKIDIRNQRSRRVPVIDEDTD